jgi:4-diphosphocytidyl-2-C-methyl-D-erythritol kinase
MRLQTQAPAKINVCLLLGPVRESDGRHELATVMQSLSLHDRVVLTEDPDADADTIACEGVAPEDNIAATAVRLFRERFSWDGPPVHVEITKRVPVAGGMAGGSADAGAVLRLLRHATGHGTAEELEQLAFALGADVPSQVRPGRTLATGAGETLERVPGVARYGVVVVPSTQGLSSADVYREADALGLPRSADSLADGLERIRAALPDLADEFCVNELEPAALSLRPDLQAALDGLDALGADRAIVSGSGPTVVGLFRDIDAARAAADATPGSVLAKPVGPDAGEVT